MTIINESIKDKKGYRLHVIKTDKYKTNTFVWKWKAPLTKDDVTKRALLPQVLQSSTKDYQTTTELRAYLDELYGASFYVDLAKKGEYHIISFTLEVANEKFLKDSSPLMEKGMEFLASVILNPNVENQSFHNETVEKEKRNLKQRIQSVYDDKMRYSNARLVEEMCKGEAFALHANGEKEDVDGITSEQLFQYYNKALKEDELDFYVIGDVDATNVETICQKLFPFEGRTPLTVEKSRDSEKHGEPKEIKENQDVKQGKLNIGYRTNITFGDEDYFPLTVFNGIFGGFSHSKLFINVREKASLAYYAASLVESHKGLLMVMSGIDNKNYDQAVKIIHEQMDAMKNGDFTEDEITQTKAVIRNQLLETIDTARGSVEVLYHNVISKESITIDDWLKQVDKTTKDEIVNAAKKIELDTIYFLTGNEEDAQ
ncbi:EF-P 5-aminopentanol modification-associated protein YfmF [Falsibacillus pallidus]|uniref:Putative Zn-dependent peptidase n=1 Tax=Falsibacillus pallidus TaxID=493781 RepID=A0A370GVV0_9BACI|nr:pitrilysin family protein [Falsibacillus pallidus]RDI47390.1 putative Zn-dependent peptidase [Falsibacillus pallidus]